MLGKDENRFEVGIVGASLAGSAAASILGSKGISTLLIDKAQFPRAKACGEGLSRAGWEVLKRLGVSIQDDNNSYIGYQIICGDRTASICSPDGAGYAVDRLEIDTLLANKASSFNSVTFKSKECVEEVNFDGEIKTNLNSYSVKNLIIANGGGSNSFINSLGVKPTRVGVMAKFDGEYKFKQNQVSIFLDKHFEVYCTPHGGSGLTICILSSAPHLNLRKLIESKLFLSQIFNRLGFLGERISPVLGKTQLGNTIYTPYFKNTYFVGDAVEQFDPLGGMGMTHALISGELAAKGIIKQYEHFSTPKEAQEWYAFHRENAARPFRRFTKLCEYTFNTVRRYPPILSLVSSRLGNLALKATQI